MTGPRVLVVPDKFKGTLTAAEAAAAILDGVARVLPDAEVRLLPFADGGEGTVDAALAVGFSRRLSEVTGPLGDPVEALWALREGVAVIETAAASGLALVQHPTPETALAASTVGTGQLVLAALDAGARRVVLGVGGSATSDGGLGALLALGARATGPAGDPVVLDLAGLDPRLADCELVLCTDVANPFCGPRGAAEVFAPQKGADAAAVAVIDDRLRGLAAVLRAATGVDLLALGWGGAGGGIAGGLHAALGARAADGVDTMAELLGLDAALQWAELVIVGEGSIDEQSRMGKAPVGIARRAAAAGVPCLAVCGTTPFDRPNALAADGIFGIAAADRAARLAGSPASDALAHPAYWVTEATHHLLESCRGAGERSAIAACPNDATSRPALRRAARALVVLERDLPDPPDRPLVRVVDPAAPAAEEPGVDDPGSWIVDSANPPILLLVGGSTRSFDGDSTDAELLAEFASLVQDVIVDETGRPWPEVNIDGRIRVLDARVAGGTASWCAAETPFCPIGELRARTPTARHCGTAAAWRRGDSPIVFG